VLKTISMVLGPCKKMTTSSFIEATLGARRWTRVALRGPNLSAVGPLITLGPGAAEDRRSVRRQIKALDLGRVSGA
jgi:hypothetical protein